MTTIDITLPDSIAQAARQHALRDDISMDYFISLAVAEKIASINSWEQKTGKALNTVESFELQSILNQAGNDKPQKGDERVTR